MTGNERMDTVLSGLLLAGFLIPAVRSDWSRRIIPNGLVLGLFSAKTILLLWKTIRTQSFDGSGWKPSAGGLLLAGGIGLLCLLFSRDGLGMGDVKLMLALGWYLETTALLRGLLFAALAAVPAAIWLVAVKKADKDTAIPFAPFLAFGAVLSIFRPLLP
ncbi:MAG: prepilin peptidase [Clostridia bacterium]|nr:prepilin peptidase [Clostridia bacterium]